MKRRLVMFCADDHLRDRALDRHIYLMCEAEEKEEYKQQGIAIGKQEGIVIGKQERDLEITLEMIEEQYPNHDYEWVHHLDESQLKYARRLLMKQMPYNDFYNMTQKFKY